MGIAQKQTYTFFTKNKQNENTLVLFQNINFFNISFKFSSDTYISRETNARID